MEAMALDEMDQSPRQKSAREELEHTAHSQIREKEQEINDLKQEINDLKQKISTKEQEIKDLKQEIRAKEQDLRMVDLELANAVGTAVRSALDAKVQFLRQVIISLLEEIKSRDQLTISFHQEMISLRDELKSLRSVHAGLLANVSGPSESEATPVDHTLRIRNDIVEQTIRMCGKDGLSGLLKTGLGGGLRFPVIPRMWDSLPTNRDKLFKQARHGEECYDIAPLVNLIVAPPMPAPTADTEDSFHHFWDTVIEEPLRFFYDGPWLAERNKSGEGSTSGTRPDKVVRFGFNFYALWRGEEKGPATFGEPKEELISKLDWTYKHLPYLMAYHARGCLVTFCALYMDVNTYGQSQKMCDDLIQFDTSRAVDRLELVIACINLAKLLRLMGILCEGQKEKSDMPLIRRISGKVIRPCGRKVEKKYPDADLYMRVAAIYEATSPCPNVEHLLHRCDRERVIMVKRCEVAKPINYDQLIACLQCLCEALQWLHGNGFMHRDIRWENVLRDKENAEKWVLVDLDDVIRTSDEDQSHRLDPNSHAPEMAKHTRHDTMVDIWGIGHLLRTSYILLDAKLEGLRGKCLLEDPYQRPTATECLEILKA